ncbi:MAG: hypothetical protein N3D75_02790 [Candidatus Aenigmarchaeota archaeon]|nr:hypothetical protein [Candidatus Aenigmarchaeota archaeon]
MNIINDSKKMYTVEKGRLYNGDGKPFYFRGIRQGTVYFPGSNNGEQLQLTYFPNGNRRSDENRYIAAGRDGVVFELLSDSAIVIFS